MLRNTIDPLSDCRETAQPPAGGRRRLFMLGAAILLGNCLPAIHPAHAEAPPRVKLVTTLGTIEVQLDPQRAPKTVANFVQYVKDGFYAGTIFHRVIPGFMIQGGGFTVDMQQKSTRAPIALESKNGLKNLRGTIAMARTSDPNSATSQFFINLADNPSLDYPQPDGQGYAVFGQVIAGMDVVDRIAKVATQSTGPYQNVPVTPVIIQQAIFLK